MHSFLLKIDRFYLLLSISRTGYNPFACVRVRLAVSIHFPAKRFGLLIFYGNLFIDLHLLIIIFFSFSLHALLLSVCWLKKPLRFTNFFIINCCSLYLFFLYSFSSTPSLTVSFFLYTDRNEIVSTS